MKAALFLAILIALAAILGTRRIGFGQWQFYAVGALVAVAGVVGRFA